MSGIVGLFASIGDHIPILKKEKFCEPHPEGEISRFHYRGTVMIILTFCILVTTTEWVSGTDSIINCLHHGPIPENVIQNYCYIIGTFSVPRHYVDHHSDLGNRVSQTGVGPYDPTTDYIEMKAYYQWVPFVLFLQAVMFYIPHIVFKALEGGKVKLIIAGLNRWVMDKEERAGKEQELAKYLVGTKGTHRTWCLKVLFAQTLYLVNVVGNIFLTDCFLGWEFYTYGVRAASFIEEDSANRVDPMSRIFPRVTKCTFKKFGPSGTIQRHDAQCVLPINIINEKIYVFLWFWFGILSSLTILNLIWAFGIVFASKARSVIIKRKLHTSPRRKTLKVDVPFLVNHLDFGDWKLLYHLLRNMDGLVFGEFMEQLTIILKKTIETENKDDTLSLHSLLKPPPPGGGGPRAPEMEMPEDEEEFLRQHSGDYLKKGAGKREEAL